METFSDYTIHCTPEQAKKALELGAQIVYINTFVQHSTIETLTDKGYAVIPTAEQMIGWLDTKKVHVDVCYESDDRYYYVLNYLDTISDFYSTRPEATLAGIDAALNYLIKNKK